MSLTTLQIDARYDPAFLKSLTPITGSAPWGSGPGTDAGAQTIFFDDAYSLDVVDAVNAYDAAWLARIKPDRIEVVARARKSAIINTFSFNGLALRLDETTENALSKAVTALQRQPAGTTVDWEVARGQFMSFDLATVQAIGDAAFLHVQAAFTNAKRLTGLIAAAQDIAALNAIDLNDGWGSGTPATP